MVKREVAQDHVQVREDFPEPSNWQQTQMRTTKTNADASAMPCLWSQFGEDGTGPNSNGRSID